MSFRKWQKLIATRTDNTVLGRKVGGASTGTALTESRVAIYATILKVMSTVSEKMRADWNERALEDAHYYVAFGGRDQDEDEFLATAADELRFLKEELKRFPKNANRRAWRALEIGCG